MIGINILLILVVILFIASLGFFVFNNSMNTIGNKIKVLFLSLYILTYCYLFYNNQTKVKYEKPGYVFLFNLIHSLNLLSMGHGLLTI
jgi:hypothetical protein